MQNKLPKPVSLRPAGAQTYGFDFVINLLIYLSDSEVLTMEIVTEYQGIETDVGIWKYFRKHWKDWFPALKSRTTFVRQAANLWQYKAMLQQKLAEQLGALDDDVHLIDGVPIPLCYLCRASRCRSFEDIADYNYCAAKDMHYYGFHGHVLISLHPLQFEDLVAS